MINNMTAMPLPNYILRKQKILFPCFYVSAGGIIASLILSFISNILCVKSIYAGLEMITFQKFSK